MTDKSSKSTFYANLPYRRFPIFFRLFSLLLSLRTYHHIIHILSPLFTPTITISFTAHFCISPTSILTTSTPVPPSSFAPLAAVLPLQLLSPRLTTATTATTLQVMAVVVVGVDMIVMTMVWSYPTGILFPFTLLSLRNLPPTYHRHTLIYSPPAHSPAYIRACVRACNRASSLAHSLAHSLSSSTTTTTSTPTTSLSPV